MLTIYHNSRCRKSREGLEILEKSGKDFQIREYLKEPFSKGELERLLMKLKMAPIELVRQKEKVWKEQYKGKDLSDEEVLKIITENPILVERPIVETDGSAVIGRPPSQIKNII